MRTLSERLTQQQEKQDKEAEQEQVEEPKPPSTQQQQVDLNRALSELATSLIQTRGNNHTTTPHRTTPSC